MVSLTDVVLTIVYLHVQSLQWPCAALGIWQVEQYAIYKSNRDDNLNAQQRIGVSYRLLYGILAFLVYRDAVVIRHYQLPIACTLVTLRINNHYTAASRSIISTLAREQDIYEQAGNAFDGLRIRAPYQVFHLVFGEWPLPSSVGQCTSPNLQLVMISLRVGYGMSQPHLQHMDGDHNKIQDWATEPVELRADRRNGAPLPPSWGMPMWTMDSQNCPCHDGWDGSRHFRIRIHAAVAYKLSKFLGTWNFIIVLPAEQLLRSTQSARQTGHLPLLCDTPSVISLVVSQGVLDIGSAWLGEKARRRYPGKFAR